MSWTGLALASDGDIESIVGGTTAARRRKTLSIPHN